jgi:hypothetical protein
MGIGVKPREHLERTGEGLCAGACTGLCCRCRLLVQRRRPTLCCRQGAVLAPAAVADGPRACSLCAREGEGEPQRRPLQPYQRGRGATRREAGGRRQEAEGRRRRNWSNKSQLCFCGRFVSTEARSDGPACCFPRIFPGLPRMQRALLSRACSA